MRKKMLYLKSVQNIYLFWALFFVLKQKN